MDERTYVNVIGTKVAALNLDSAVQLISGWLEEGGSDRYVCVTDVHCIMQSHRRSDVRRAYNEADVCVPDGMPLTWVGRARGFRQMGRVYGPDLFLRLLEISAARGYKNFFLGGAEGVAENLKQAMIRRYAGLQVVGTSCPPFRDLRAEEKFELVAAINRAHADILWIGLGAPKQDLFMAEFRDKVNSRVMIGVGAAFDFHTGRVPQAPRWMMRIGLEWVFRLCVEPRRLAPRYLRNNPAFVWHIILQQAGIRNYPLG